MTRNLTTQSYAANTAAQPTAGTLGGSELARIVQNGVSVKITTSQLASDLASLAGVSGGGDFQPLDSDLTAIAALTTTSYGRSLLELADETALEALIDTLPNLGSIQGVAFTMGAYAPTLLNNADEAAFKAAVNLEAGTDFYSIAGANAAFQPIDSDLTAIAGLTTTAAGRSVLTITDPNTDRLMVWDDSAGAIVPLALADYSTEATPSAGDYIVLIRADGTLAVSDVDDLPGGGGGGLSEVVEDTDPELGGGLDLNSFDITGTGNINITGDLQCSDDVIVGDDILLASGAVINWDSADLTLTHSANTLTLAGGTLVLPDSGLQVGASNPFSDSSGTLTLQNVDALDATTESTIEAAIDTLANLTSVQGHAVTLTGDLIRSGAHSLTLTTTGPTSVTLPTSGTLATTTNNCRVATGSYTGNGSTSFAITGVGFQPKYVRIWDRHTTQTDDGSQVWETTDTMIDDNASGMAMGLFYDGGAGMLMGANRIISLNADGFTVDDDNDDGAPNANGMVYNYLCLG